MKFPRPSPSVFAYCKRSKTGGVEGLGTRLAGVCVVGIYHTLCRLPEEVLALGEFAFLVDLLDVVAAW